MRGKRSKQYRKLMEKFSFSFDFRQPYQVLLDAAIIQDSARCKMRLGAMLEGTLHGEIKPMITQCCIRHLYTAPATTDDEKRAKEGWIDVAKAAERRRCGHHELEQPLSALECLMSVVDPRGSGSNKHRYVVATQDLEVRRKMREVAGVPLVYINRSVMILEPMAEKTEKVREADEKGKIRAGLKGGRPASSSALKRKRDDDHHDEDVGLDGDGDMPDRARAIVAAEKKTGGAAGGGGRGRAEPAAKKQRKVKGEKGPNPLSMKKTKMTKEQQQQQQQHKSSATREVEDERSTVRKAAKTDPQAAGKAVDAVAAADGDAGDGLTEGPRKRKRKRKPTTGGQSGDGDGGGGEGAVAGASVEVVAKS
ncbi:hypothetical protein LTR36_003175 [Oleoguttula mirabilis]|uniref:U three protein 23 n=1 Tax=Oleoguttula mirabilis TaxID=1507867 RepID=A0AAV9JX61_9PEZI|nr:hypothetical protein LTR36_003175 [Oleoguttula mirabilis]